MSNIIIRSATVEDLPILYDFEQGIITAERPFDPTLQDGHINYYDIKTMIESNEDEVTVAIVDQKIVGSAYGKILPAKHYLKHSHYAYLAFMFVDPNYRGMGVNKKIVEKLVRWAKSKDINEVRLDVYSDNAPALRAYEKAGFDRHLVNMRMGI